jgi:lysozyme family protein
MTLDDAFTRLLTTEGGYVNDPADPGGETKFGISKAAFPNFQIATLTEDQAKTIYAERYWAPMRCSELPDPIAYAVFDAAVNQGVAKATFMLRFAARLDPQGPLDDSVLARIQGDVPGIFERFRVERLYRYALSKNFERFGRGWIRRVLRLS